MNLYRSTILIAFFGITACSPARRLSRILDKHPELMETETIIIKDTIELPERYGSFDPIEITTIDWDSVFQIADELPRDEAIDILDERFFILDKNSQIHIESSDSSLAIDLSIDTLNNLSGDFRIRDGPVVVEREVSTTTYKNKILTFKYRSLVIVGLLVFLCLLLRRAVKIF